MNNRRAPHSGDTQNPFWFLGGRAQILVPGTATGGTLSVMEFTDPKGHAPPLHVHEAEDEIWIVLDGEITFFVGDDRYDLFDIEAILASAEAYRLRVAGPPPVA
ncbi:cupin domain-containing protein [Nonomuraea sp. NPDC049141]|uniref:cupin domain-containing protein n=1 Tax=unclassified Nonomuraea TaxID=2593643 RepID=UPI0033C96888